MTRDEEISELLKQITPMMNNFGSLSKSEANKLGKLFARWMNLNNERIDEIQNTAYQTSEELTEYKETLNEYETTIALTEAFLVENDLYESFLVFSDEVINDFLKDQKPKLRLV